MFAPCLARSRRRRVRRWLPRRAVAFGFGLNNGSRSGPGHGDCAHIDSPTSIAPTSIAPHQLRPQRLHPQPGSCLARSRRRRVRRWLSRRAVAFGFGLNNGSRSGPGHGDCAHIDSPTAIRPQRLHPQPRSCLARSRRRRVRRWLPRRAVAFGFGLNDRSRQTGHRLLGMQSAVSSNSRSARVAMLLNMPLKITAWMGNRLYQ